MAKYKYSSLRDSDIRLLRILPNADENSQIECRLSTHSVLNSGTSHHFEALSYVWGSKKSGCPIYLEGHEFTVKANLYAALSHLRDQFVDRVLWVDAICINQEDKNERGKQVQSMAKIYAKASRVVVWLGEGDGATGFNQALEEIRVAAFQQSVNAPVSKTHHQAILRLLQRPWFERIWVLQEVAAARHVLIKSGRTEIDGFAFSSGIGALSLPFHTCPGLESRISSVVNLMRDATLRQRYQDGDSDRFTLDIYPLGQLADMYHNRKTTERHDKVYALLGMASDDPSAVKLTADYDTPWKDVFQSLVQLALSSHMSVGTWNDKETAVINGKGCVLAEITAVERVTSHEDSQRVTISWRNVPDHFDTNATYSWDLSTSVKAIYPGDAICLLEGASRPTIIRFREDYAVVINTGVPLTDELRKLMTSIAEFPSDFLLIWDWDNPGDESQTKTDYESYNQIQKLPHSLEVGPQGSLKKASRLRAVGQLLGALKMPEEAENKYRAAMQICELALKSAAEEEIIGVMELLKQHFLEDRGGWSPFCLAAHNGYLKMFTFLCNNRDDILGPKGADRILKILHLAAINDHNAILDLLLAYGKVDGGSILRHASRIGQDVVVSFVLGNKTIDPDSKDEYGQTSLCVAADNGHEAVVDALLSTKKVSPDCVDKNNATPLFYAVHKRYSKVIALLCATGKVDLKFKNKEKVTPLWWAAENGHNDVVKTILATGKVDPDSKNMDGLTALMAAVENGHDDVVKSILATGKVDPCFRDRYHQTPLLVAAEKGHHAVVKTLLATGKVDLDSKDQNGKTPLARAASSGHDIVVKTLLATGKVDPDSRDKFGETPLTCAASSGHDAAVKTLLATGKVDPDSKDDFGKTPLTCAAEKGHHAVVKTLLATGKVDPDSKDNFGKIPLTFAASSGHDAVVRTLLATGKGDPDSKDEYDMTPLAWAAWLGHDTVVKTLLATGKVDPESKDQNGGTPLARAAYSGHDAVVNTLLATGKVDPDSKDKHGNTPLARAAYSGHDAVVNTLLATGKVDPDSKDKHGETPLASAASSGHDGAVRTLLATGKVDPDSKDKHGNTPLSAAAEKGYNMVVKTLLATDKVDLDSKDKHGKTPLARAAWSGHDTVMKTLLATGKVNPESKDKHGKTPLALAALSGHDAAIRTLLATGKVDPDSKDNEGNTPLTSATGATVKTLIAAAIYQ